ncbi:MAG: hypothetical protein FWC27_09145, partial [Firmicutes bacterium]|nr:hypothetical protein [Bacillota bacterium]
IPVVVPDDEPAEPDNPAKPPDEPVLEAVEQFENYVAPSDGLGIKATAVDGNSCVATNTGFTLTLTEPLGEKYVKQWLKASPAFDYTLKKTGALEYRLTPKQALEKNTLYVLSFDPLQTDNGMEARAGNSWAFQTRKGFALERTFPMDEGTGVPVDSVIELTFTCEVNIKDLQKQVSISPKLGGSDWRKTGVNTYAFLASGETMKEGTVYEVRVKGALADALGSETLGKDQAFKFRTEEKEEEFWSGAGYENNAFMASEKPAFTLRFYPAHDEKKLPTRVFRFDSPEAYAEAVNDSLNYDYWSGKTRPELNTDGMQKVLDEKLEIMGDEGGGVVVLPKALPKGLYAARFTTNGRTLTCLFQVTDLSAYAMGGSGGSLFWVNDLATSQPVKSAEISLAGGKAVGKTDAQGLLTVKNSNPDDAYTAYWAQSGGERLLIMLGGDGGEDGFHGMDYWKYIYCDKKLYKPEDTLKFFGVLAPKQAGVRAVNEVTAVVEENYWDRTEASEVKARVPVKNGVFEGEIRLPELAPGFYCLSLYSGEERLGTTYFEVKIYRKPAYSLKLTVDRPIVWAGEEATATAAAAYFEGTPLAGLELDLDGDIVKTDGFGKAKKKISVSRESDSLVTYRGISAEAELPEIGRVYEHAYVQSVNSDVEIEARAKREGSAVSLDIQAFTVDFTGLDYIEWYGDNKHLKDFSGSLPLKVTWTRVTYKETKTSLGKRYDPYTKTYAEYFDYDYERIEKREGSKTLTVKGKDNQSFPLPLTPDGEYILKIEGKDSKGRAFEREAWYYGKYHDRYNYDFGKTAYVRDNDGKDAYAVGDKVSLSVYENYGEGAPIEAGDGAVLFVRASDKILDSTVSKENLLEFTFDGKVLPNINVYGVLFDGREYVEHWYPYSVSIDTDSRALRLEVTPDKDSYRPGETAKLKLRLTGPDGNPVQGTVNLNMVDEALLALREEYSDIAEIFGDTYGFYPATSISHILVRNTGGGEKGDDGGGDSDRSDIRDTALFETVVTDKKGQASAEVKLPDNVTSWRLFWQAFRPGDVMAGSGRANLIVTLPFFVDIRMGEAFLTGDKPTLGIRNAGTALDGGSVKYTVEIPTLQFKQTESAKPSVWYEMPLPALKPGEHTLSVTGEYGEYKDKLTVKFTVADGIADHMETQTLALAEGTKFGIPARGTVHLTFTDRQKSQVMRGLWRILCGSSIRAEQLIAKQAAREVLAAVSSGEYGWYGSDYAETIPQYQRSNGSIAPFTYGDVSDYETLLTTAWACAAMAEAFSKPAAAQYLRSQLGGAWKALALMGLAALKEPVMQDINELAQDDLPWEDRIYLALAQVFIGNGSAAKAMVSEYAAAFCDKAGQTMYVRQEIREDTVRCTANLAVAAMLLDMPEGGPLFQYVLENRGAEDHYLLQQLLVLRHKAQSVNPDCASFTYTLDGKKKQVSLFLSHSVLLTAEQLRAIRFSDVSDDIEVTAGYLAPGFPEGGNAALSVSQIYDEIDMAQTGTAYGAVSYSIDAAAPDGCYNIVHVLPAGLEFSGLVWRRGQRVWVSEVKGQQVTFTVYKSKDAGSDTFRFTARPVMTGAFRSEGTYITNTDKPEFTASIEGGAVTIK